MHHGLSVVTPPANVHRRFLPWDRPLLPQAVELLAESWSGEGPLDLSDRLVIVPTRQSGRRLREALAGFAARRGAAVFPPRVMLPEALLAPTPADAAAAKLDSLLAWEQVFRAVELDEFRTLFPMDPPARSVSWAMRLAEEFVRLQRALAESGLRLSDVARRAGEGFPEVERWEQIGELERRHDEALGSVGLRDAAAARIARATQAATADAPSSASDEMLAGVRCVLVIAAPDPQPLALDALAALASARAVEIVVFAPETEAGAFDGWGRPHPEAWSQRVLPLPDFAHQVHLCADPAAQAAQIAELARRYDVHDGVLAVGVADPDVLPLLESEFARAGRPVFNPEGRLRRGDRLFQLLQALARLAREDGFAAVGTLARCPDFLGYLQASVGPTFSAARMLRALDALHTRHLPPTLGDALRQAQREAERREPRASAGQSADAGEATVVTGAGKRERTPFGELVPVLRLVSEFRDILTSGTFVEGATRALAMVFGERRFSTSDVDDAAMMEAADSWETVIRAVAASSARFGELAIGEWWDIALGLYGESVRYDDKPADAVELQGWLELLWEDAPHLVVAGFNDGRVPDAIVGDPFLPESLRERLGLKTNAARFARDAYLLQALGAWRSSSGSTAGVAVTAGGGRLDLLLGKTSAAGDPLRPSRLLLRCADEELPDRITRLFRPVEAARVSPAWRRAWRLKPPPVERVTSVAVTGLRAWLACPFRFYLSRVLRMEAVDPAKTELDVFDFGTLCHAALEAFGSEPTMRDVTDPASVREFLLAQLELAATKRFGAALTLPLVVQLESARQRLSRAADVQAETRAEGWVIEQVERPFEIRIGGLTVTGKIDRIDRHEKTGALRVLDYKTSDRPVNPEAAHIRGMHRDERAAAFARFVYNAKEQVWTDLQLPLYLRAVAAAPELINSPALECGYFNLPKAAGETGIQPWADYTRELDAAAWRCAEGVAAAIEAGEFWPPNETLRPEQDDFAALFHHGVAESVAWPGAADSHARQAKGDVRPSTEEKR
jgi:ATP-dependent helicase/nuclease subunit B